MLELERNKPIETEALSEFFSRCGWQETAAKTKLEWAMAAADEWVSCRLDGELVGFARSCRLSPSNRVVFDALVDPRFSETGLRGMIVAMLSATAGDLERVSVFRRARQRRTQAPPNVVYEFGPAYVPPASPDAYLGKMHG